MSNYFYLLTLSYKGTAYSGWQIQSQGEKTIQGELNTALAKVAKSQEVKSLASGRTDAGVHALAQVCRVDIPLQIEAQALKRALNSRLPEDIRIDGAQSCTEDFHPIRDSKSKEYQYLFSLERPGVFSKELLVYCPYQLNFELMNQACKLLIGEHDFQNYFCLGSEVDSTVREIYACEISYQAAHWPLPAHFVLKIRGNGFLKQMVRLIMGSLWALGRGKISLEQFQKSLEDPLDNHLAAVAPAHGLYMSAVEYKFD